MSPAYKMYMAFFVQIDPITRERIQLRTRGGEAFTPKPVMLPVYATGPFRAIDLAHCMVHDNPDKGLFYEFAWLEDSREIQYDPSGVARRDGDDRLE